MSIFRIWQLCLGCVYRSVTLQIRHGGYEKHYIYRDIHYKRISVLSPLSTEITYEAADALNVCFAFNNSIISLDEKLTAADLEHSVLCCVCVCLFTSRGINDAYNAWIPGHISQRSDGHSL